MALYYSKNYFDKYKGSFGCVSEEDFNLVWEFFPKHLPNGKLLDLACGSGAIGNRLKALFSKLSVFGADLSLNLLTWAKFPKCQSDALYLPFRDNSFDCIVAGAAFHHFPSIEKAIRECSRCLKSNGVLFAYDPNKFHPQRLIMMTDPLRHIFYRNGDHAISPKHFKNILIKNGFKKVEHTYVSFWSTDASLLAKLNHKIFLELSKRKMSLIIPVITPWFVISAIKS